MQIKQPSCNTQIQLSLRQLRRKKKVRSARNVPGVTSHNRNLTRVHTKHIKRVHILVIMLLNIGRKGTSRDEAVRRTQVQLSFTEITPIIRHTWHKRNAMLAFSKTDIAFRTPETTLHKFRNIM